MKTLLLSTVREFFRQRAGFFLVFIFLVFGFLTSREHYAFALFFLTDEWGMVALFVLWSGYMLLCAQFISHQFTQPEYVFLHQARLWPMPKRIYRLALMALGFIQPLLYYGIYVIAMAIQDKILVKTIPLFIFWLLLSAGLVAVAEWRLHHPDIATSTRQSGWKLPFRRPSSLVFWILEWLVRERGLTLLLSKIGAMLFILATLVYDRTGTYDLRLPAIGFSLAYLMNSGLSNELYHWESEVWLWGRSLPAATSKRFFRAILLHAILLVPETLFALRNGGNQLSIWEWGLLYFLGLACLMLHHSRLYRITTQAEETGLPHFVGFILVTLLILYGVPVWGLGLVLLLTAAWLWFRESNS